MYIRQSSRTYKGKTFINYVLDYHESDSELQDLIAKVQSAAPPSLATDATHPAAANSDLLAVHVDQVRTEESREAGPVHVGYQFWQRLGLDAILAQAGLS